MVVKAKPYTKAESLMSKASSQLKKMIEDLKKLIIEYEKLLEKIQVKAWKEGYTDAEIDIIMRYAIDPLPISQQKKQALYKRFAKVKEVKIESVTSRSNEDKADVREIICLFRHVNGDVDDAKRILCDVVMKGKDGFKINLVDDDVIGFTSLDAHS